MSVYIGYLSSVCVPKPLTSTCLNYLKGTYNYQPYLKCDLCPNNTYAYLDTCISTCPNNTYLHRNRYCVCQGGNIGQYNLSIYDQCSNLLTCPIGMSFDIFSHSCYKCPYGCISCTYRDCTSCSPGFYLIIAPTERSCRRMSTLGSCSSLTSVYLYNNTCIPANTSNLYLDLCVNNIPGCQLC